MATNPVPPPPLPTTIPLAPPEPATVPPLPDPGGAPAIPGVTLEGELGRGGMGVVYRGRDAAFGRALAVKVLRGPADADLERRFLAEARLTGQLQHPGVVPVHALGKVEGGPYFTMKLVQGRTLAALLRERAQASRGGSSPEEPRRPDVPGSPPDVPRFLKYFEQVCQAVAYAHAQGVIHRDLKPANVMVGAFGEVQVMDWGLAKVVAVGEGPNPPGPPSLRGKGGDQTGDVVLMPPSFRSDLPPSPFRGGGAGGGGVDPTRHGALLGTPTYMAPEQARGEIDRLDARTDVFALGALLCEILTGRPPYPGSAVADVLAQAKAGDLADAHARLEGCGADAELVALARACLAAEPVGRPADAGAVAQAVGGHLAAVQERLTAEREARAAALARLTAERRARRLAVGLAAVLLLGGGVAAWLGWLADRRRQQAETAEAGARAAQGIAEARYALAREAVDVGLADVADDPDLRKADFTRLRRRLLTAAIPFYQRLTAQKPADLEGRAEQAWAHGRLAHIAEALGDLAEAAKHHGRMRDLLAEVVAAAPERGAFRRDLAAALFNLAAVVDRQGDQARAADLARAALREQAVVVAAAPADRLARQFLATHHNGLGRFLASLGRPAEAEVEYRRALDLLAALIRDRPDEPAYRQDLARTHTNLGLLLEDPGRTAEAEAAYRQALGLRRALVQGRPTEPAYRQELAITLNGLGGLLANLGRTAEAEAAYREALDLRAALVRDFPTVPDHRYELAASFTNLGLVLGRLGQGPEGEAAARQAVDLLTGLVKEFPDLPPYRRDLASSQVNLALALANRGRPQEAEGLLRQALDLRTALAREQPAVLDYRRDLAASANHLGTVLLGQGRQAEAEAAFRQAHDLLAALVRDQPGFVSYRQQWARSLNHLGAALAGQGRAAEAEVAYRQALDLRAALVHDHPHVPALGLELAGTQVNLGHLVRDAGRPAEGLAWYDQALPLLEAYLRAEPRDPTGRQFLRNAHAGRGGALIALGRYPEARAAADQALAAYDDPPRAAGLRRLRTAAVVAAGLMRDAAWPLLWGWPR